MAVVSSLCESLARLELHACTLAGKKQTFAFLNPFTIYTTWTNQRVLLECAFLLMVVVTVNALMRNFFIWYYPTRISSFFFTGDPAVKRISDCYGSPVKRQPVRRLADLWCIGFLCMFCDDVGRNKYLTSVVRRSAPPLKRVDGFSFVVNSNSMVELGCADLQLRFVY